MRSNAIAGCLALGLFAAGCFLQPEIWAPEVVSMRIGLGGDVCGVSTAEATVSAPDMDDVGPVALKVGADAIEGQVIVPAGTDRAIHVAAYNSSKKRVYYGAALVDVVAGQVTRAHIVLQQDTTNCGDTGTVIIVGEISHGTRDGGIESGTKDAGTGTRDGGIESGAKDGGMATVDGGH